MAFTIDDFEKVWASTSPLTPYEFSDSNYQQGWNFIGATPPARQMWDFLQKRNDEKTQWLYNNKLSLSGGTMTGMINLNGQAINFGTDYQDTARIYKISNLLRLVGGSNTSDGSHIDVGSPSASEHGIVLDAKDNSNETKLIAKPDGTLTWGSKAVIVGNEYSETFTVSSIDAGAQLNVGTLAHTPKYFSVLYVSGSNWAATSVGISTPGAVWMKNNLTSTLSNIKFTVNYIY